VRAVSKAASSGSPLLPSAAISVSDGYSPELAQRLLYLFGINRARLSASTQRREIDLRLASIQRRSFGVPME
jgi:hypothetical protein